MIATILIDMFVTSSLCIALAQAGSARRRGPARAALRALRGALSNPLPWAIALGGAARRARLALSGRSMR